MFGLGIKPEQNSIRPDDLANRRKPRVYTTLSGKEIFVPEWPLDFCIWLQNDGFDIVVAEHRLKLT